MHEARNWWWGEATLAEMQEGGNGFLEYKWPGESKPAGKAAAKAAASKAAGNAPGPLAKAAAKAAASTSDSSELVLHNLRITKASKPPRTYLTACTCGGPGPHKPRLIVEYSEKKDGVNHESKCHNAKRAHYLTEIWI